ETSKKNESTNEPPKKDVSNKSPEKNNSDELPADKASSVESGAEKVARTVTDLANKMLVQNPNTSTSDPS
ncbi:9980_t:CDS:2, partial [Racocetra fulgida]